MKKLKIWVDMDDTLFNFTKAVNGATQRNPKEMYKKGFFRNLEPTDGSKEFIRCLLHQEAVGTIEVGILTKPVATSPISYKEKVESIREHFPELLNKITMTQNKSQLRGDILIDDHECVPHMFNIRPPLVGGASWGEILEAIHHRIRYDSDYYLLQLVLSEAADRFGTLA